MSRNLQKKLLWLFIVLLIATLAFIFINSMLSRDESAELSGSVLDIFDEIVVFFGGDPDDDHWIRKLAHFIEFAALGFELTVIAQLKEQRDFKSLLNCALLGLLCADIDEGIQIFSGRGSMVQDVFLDFCGVVCGLLIALFIAGQLRKRFKKIDKHTD